MVDEDGLVIKNCRLYNQRGKDLKYDLLIKDGVIDDIIRAKSRIQERGYRIIDAKGRIVAPGFIDLHIQGAGGADVLDASTQSIATISRVCARFGVTSFLATTVYFPGRKNDHLRIASNVIGKELGGARCLGLHLEGPFISSVKRGMIQPQCITAPSIDVLESIEHEAEKPFSETLRMMTIAPELEGSEKIIHRLVDRGVVASFGHSNATYEQTVLGIRWGITHVTHLFNAMGSIHHRAPGPLPAILENKNCTAQIISDGVHIHPRMVKFACELMGPKRLIPITDGMRALGLDDGIYLYNGIEYEAKNGTARYKDGTLIGTALGLNRLMARFLNYSGWDLTEVIRAATQLPASVIGIDRYKGKIEKGMDADIVVLDKNLEVYTTIVGGKVVFMANNMI